MRLGVMMDGTIRLQTYLDWNASAPLRPQARAAIEAALDLVGNPSSVHASGRAARQAVELARADVAALIGARARNVIFTSGATEANALALSPAWVGEPQARLLISGIEHPSVRAGGRFPESAREDIPVTRAGVVDLDWLGARLAKGGRMLVSVMLANNETGIIQPVAAVAEMVHAAGGLLHVDAVQGPGKIDFDINVLGADLLSLSAHKFGGPKGIGALILASDDLHIAEPLMKGGGQERGARPGTENVIGIVGFGAAAAAVRLGGAEEAVRAGQLRDRLEAGLREACPGAVIFGAECPRLPNTTMVAIPGLKAETALIALDLEGIAVSAGSACSSGKVAASPVLAAMGVSPDLAQGAVRVSLGPDTTEVEIEIFLNAWTKRVMGLSKGSRGLAA
jgi:cysteine desulfurase